MNDPATWQYTGLAFVHTRLWNTRNVVRFLYISLQKKEIESAYAKSLKIKEYLQTPKYFFKMAVHETPGN